MRLVSWLMLIVCLSLFSSCKKGSSKKGILDGVHHIAKSQKGTVYALLIGVNKYKVYPNRRNWKWLRYAEADVTKLKDVLSEYGHVPSNHIEVLLGEKVTRRNVLNTIASWLGQARKDDTALVYFSGHGAVGGDGISYWMTHETTKDTKEQGIGHHTLNGVLAGLKTNRVVMLVDACNSGQGLARSKGGSKGRLGVIDPKVYSSRGRVIITSSQQSELSYESNKFGHGIFSYVLMNALKGKADVDKDGIVDASEVYRYLDTHVPKLAKAEPEGGEQHPVRDISGRGLFALSFPGTRRKPAKQPPELEASLRIESTPPSASVSVDGIDMGETPVTLKVKSGVRRIELTLRGYKPWTRRVYAYRRRLRRKHVVLRKIPGFVHEKPKERQIEVRKPSGGQARQAGSMMNIKGLKGSKAVWIPKGSFTMGSPKTEANREKDEIQHKVTISRGFWMMQTEVTQGEFKQLMGYNPSSFARCGLSCPVEQVSWHEAAAFANKLSVVQGLSSCFSCNGRGKNVMCGAKSYKNYVSCEGWKLPTEAQWEYAARAGTTTPFNTGDNITTEQANYKGNAKGTNQRTIVAAKSFSPNGWGLYQMHGNVWEWVFDWYVKYSLGAVLDPVGPSFGSWRVFRGGSWINYAWLLRSAYRNWYSPDDRDVGFRLVRGKP